jgi:hypothetical protein
MSEQRATTSTRSSSKPREPMSRWRTHTHTHTLPSKNKSVCISHFTNQQLSTTWIVTYNCVVIHTHTEQIRFPYHTSRANSSSLPLGLLHTMCRPIHTTHTPNTSVFHITLHEPTALYHLNCYIQCAVLCTLHTHRTHPFSISHFTNQQLSTTTTWIVACRPIHYTHYTNL